MLIVVEPPLESLNVATKIHELAAGIGIKRVWAIMNKVTSAPVAERLENVLKERNIEVIGSIYHDSEIYNASIEGKIPTRGNAMRSSAEILDGIIRLAGIPALP